MKRMSVAALIAVRNGEKRIARALDCIAKQTRMPDWVLVSDDQSTDRTIEIARQYDFVTILHHQPGRSVADNYNFAVENAGSDLIAFLAHDDVWTPEKVEVQAGYHEAHPETLVTTAMARYIAEDPERLPPGFRAELLEGERVAPLPETLMARREVFEQVGMFDAQLKVANDVDWFSRVQDAEVPSAVIRQVLLHKYVHHGSLSLNYHDNSAELLRAMRDSIVRKRAQAEEK